MKNYWPSILLVLISLVVSFQNYTPGTWLTGWDTLHPEFDFPLNFERVINGVWREEQGLGAVAGHAHIADLPRIFLLWVVSFVAPLDLLRYFYFFLALILGPLGVYYFLEKIAFKNQPDSIGKTAAFFGGMFYLLNLGMLQHFYVPFEMFATQYAALPWLFLFATKFFLNGQKRDLILFCLITLLATPMAYAATLWYVYFASLVIYGATFSLIHPRLLANLKRLFVILFVTLVINSFWLLPNLYFLKTSSFAVSQAKINQLFSGKAFAHDLKYATLDNAAILKGFLFDWQEYRQGKFVVLLKDWHLHLQNPWVLGIGWFLFTLVVLGVLISIFKREKLALAFLPVFLFSFLFLIYGTPLLAPVLSFLREHSNLFREGLRFPWTKFSILVMFCYAFYFSRAILWILSWLKNVKVVQIISLVALSSALVLWMLPAFSGHLIGSSRRTTIPEDYFEVFDWFKNQPKNERIAVFPTPSLWGWEYYDWGFEGAGFLWFGLSQPILVRDFDRWERSNENFYWEASYAFYSQNPKLFERVLEKYQISYLVVDEHMINPAWPKAIYREELEQIMADSQKVSLAQTFGKIKIYQVSLEAPVNNFVYLLENPPAIEPAYKWNNNDQAHVENGTYVNNLAISNQQSAIYYPFRSLFTGRSREELEFIVEDRGDFFVFKKTIPEEFQNYSLQIPEAGEKELIQVDPNDLSKITYLEPEVILRGESLEIIVPKVGGYYSAQIDPAPDPKTQEAKNCNQFSLGEVKNEITSGGFLRLTSLNALNCSSSFWLPNLPHSLAYLITVDSRNIQGKSLLFWLENLNIRKADIETYLPKNSKFEISNFIQPPMEKDGIAYTLHFDNLSIGQDRSVNDLGKISVQQIPYRFLTGLKLTAPGNTNPMAQFLEPVSVRHPNPAFYEVSKLPITNYQLPVLVLSQAYHEGWQAYTIDSKWQIVNSKLSGLLTPVVGKRINNHLLVNNWENGWALKENLGPNETLVILFWPQYLEYLGFVLLLLVPAFLIWWPPELN